MTGEALPPGSVAVGVFGADGGLRAQTAAFAGLLGLPAEAAGPGVTLAALLARLDPAAPAPPCALRCRSADGRLLDLAAEALSDGGWSLAVTDITAAHDAAAALLAAREAAEAGARAKARFLATMNHELRTPLNAVIGFAETLAHDAARSEPRPDPKETEEFALHIRDAGRHLLALIDDILDLVRLDSGAYDLAGDTVDAGRLIQAAVRATSARSKGMQITVQDTTGGVRLRADERRLRRLLGHLLDNAVKFSGSTGQVAVTARRDDAGNVHIEVRDNGIGMAPEELQRALASFHQTRRRPDPAGRRRGTGPAPGPRHRRGAWRRAAAG